MIFGKRPPRAVRRHLEAEIAVETTAPGDGALDPQVIRTPPMKPFARAATPTTPGPTTLEPAFSGPAFSGPARKSAAKPKPAPRPATLPPTPKAPPRRAKAAAQPIPRDGRPNSRQAPGQIPGQIPGHTLVVGRDIRLTGEISACHRLVVEGSVEADLTDTHTLEIGDTGYFHGSATVENCVVSGNFDGDLTVSGLLAVRAGGRVGGAVRYAEIEVERGGRISGRTDVQEPRDVPDATGPDKSGPGLRPA